MIELWTLIVFFMFSFSRDMRIAFNSLGGYASVNHLHFHLFYFPYTLYTETAVSIPFRIQQNITHQDMPTIPVFSWIYLHLLSYVQELCSQNSHIMNNYSWENRGASLSLFAYPVLTQF